MRFVAGRVHRGGEAGRGAVAKLLLAGAPWRRAIGKQLLAGALMRMAGVFLAEMQQLTPKEWQRRSGREGVAVKEGQWSSGSGGGGRSFDFN